MPMECFFPSVAHLNHEKYNNFIFFICLSAKFSFAMNKFGIMSFFFFFKWMLFKRDYARTVPTKSKLTAQNSPKKRGAETQFYLLNWDRSSELFLYRGWVIGYFHLLWLREFVSPVEWRGWGGHYRNIIVRNLLNWIHFVCVFFSL